MISKSKIKQIAEVLSPYLGGWAFVYFFKNLYENWFLKKIYAPHRSMVLYPPLKATDTHMLYRVSFYFRDDKIAWSANKAEKDLLLSAPRPEYFGSQANVSEKLEFKGLLALWLDILTLRPVLLWDATGYKKLLTFLPNVINVDIQKNNNEGWGYFIAYSLRYSVSPHLFDFNKVSKKTSIVLGTGPSLDQVEGYKLEDLHVIICNTIVKNKELVAKAKPAFLVFADAVYHFGPSIYAQAFREALAEFLVEDKNCNILIPHVFYARFIQDFMAHRDRIYSIPPANHRFLVLDYCQENVVHRYENILNQMLIPLAATISDELLFVGFDGRGKNDKGFWAHSHKNNFIDLLPFQNHAHPSFFYKKDLINYAEYQAQMTETMFSTLEKNGKKVYCLNPSHNVAMQARYNENKQPF